MENKNYFVELNGIDVNDKTEKKNGLTYLSWAWAWGEVKKRYPDANYKVYETIDGCIYFTDGRTAWVKTGVIINNIEHIEYLPIMDYKNKSIPLEQITSFDVNKTIQRSLTKAVARHGLGLYIYAGEDLPEDAEKSDLKVENNKTIKPQTKTPKNAEKMNEGELLVEAHKDLDLELPFEEETKAIESLNALHDKITDLCFNLNKDTFACYTYFCKNFNVKSADELSKDQLETIIATLEKSANKQKAV